MELKIQIFDLVLAFSHMLDRVMPKLAGHHARVGFLAEKLSTELHLSAKLQRRAVISSLLHDVGTLPLRVSADDLLFERNREGHSIAGAELLRNCPPLRPLADVVRYHHTPWQILDTENPSHQLAGIVHICDRVDAFMQAPPRKRNKIKVLRAHLQAGSGKLFSPEHVEAICGLLDDAALCDRLVRNCTELVPCRAKRGRLISMAQTRHFSCFIGHVIDSRSPFTATHSVGVARTACVLGGLAGIPKDRMNVLYIAGMLHDIGKLDIPLSILEKPGPLTRKEALIMSSHARISEEWLGAVPGFASVCEWGALHHERLNGGGYPHGYTAEQLSLPSRVMAVADVFTAVTEDRPYRSGMPLKRALEVLTAMTPQHLDGELVRLVVDHAVTINTARRKAQREAARLYAHCRDVPEEQNENLSFT